MTAAASTGSELLLEVEGLSVDLPTEGGYVRVLDDVSFSIHRGEMVGLAGESGSGKTMTALAVMGLLPTRKPRAEGRILLEGRDLLALPRRELQGIRGSQVSMVFQEPMTSLHPAYTIGEQIAETVRRHLKVDRKSARRRAAELLDIVGIPNPEDRIGHYSFEFSGGMQQRAMLAMALACGPKLIIADEPTTALDVTIQAQIVELLQDLQQQFGMAVLFVTHDLGLLSQLSETLMIMYAGQIVEVAPTETILRRPRHPYADVLIQAAPHPDQRGGRLPVVPGAPPRPGRYPEGCRFAPRCAYAVDACQQPPALEAVEDGGVVRCVRQAQLSLGRP